MTRSFEPLLISKDVAVARGFVGIQEVSLLMLPSTGRRLVVSLWLEFESVNWSKTSESRGTSMRYVSTPPVVLASVSRTGKEAPFGTKARIVGELMCCEASKSTAKDLHWEREPLRAYCGANGAELVGKHEVSAESEGLMTRTSDTTAAPWPLASSREAINWVFAG